MIDRANSRKARLHQAWLFYLALFSPCLLWFSYVFVASLIYAHLEVVLMVHIGWMVLSVMFCSLWVASEGFKIKPKVGVALLGLFGFSMAQVLLHTFVFYAGCMPVAELMSN